MATSPFAGDDIEIVTPRRSSLLALSITDMLVSFLAMDPRVRSRRKIKGLVDGCMQALYLCHCIRARKQKPWPILFNDYLLKHCRSPDFVDLLENNSVNHIIRVLERFTRIVTGENATAAAAAVAAMASSQDDRSNIDSHSAPQERVLRHSVAAYSNAGALASSSTVKAITDFTSEDYKAEAELLLAFLQSHHLDIYSCTIGMRPSLDVLKLCRHFEGATIRRSGSSDSAGIDAVSQIIAWSMLDDPMLLMREVKSIAAILKGELNLVVGDIVLVDRFGLNDSSNNAAVSLPGQEFVFARVVRLPLQVTQHEQKRKHTSVLGPLVDRRINRHILSVPDRIVGSPLSTSGPRSYLLQFAIKPENRSGEVDPEYILPVASSVKESLAQSLKSLEKLVHNPFDRYYKEMINLVEQRMNALLHSMKTTNRAITSPLQRISHPILKRVSTILDLEAPTTSLSNSSSPHASPSVPSTPPPMMLSSSSLSSSSKGESYESLLDVLRRGNTNDLDLSDLVSVLRIKTFLSNFRASAECEQLIKDLDDLHSAAFMSVDDSMLFAPTKVTTIAQFQAIQFSAFIKMNVNRMLGLCDSALSWLSVLEENVLNGSQKRELTNWWLTEIRKNVMAFLRSLGYDANAYPDDYINQRPSDFDKVRTNRAIIRAILDKTNDPHKVSAFISDLKGIIYPRIDAFLYDAKVVCLHRLRGDALDCSDIASVSYTQIATEFEAAKEQFPAQLRAMILDLVKDIEYIEEMKAAESPSHTRVSFHIVPISGLIISIFSRFENEINTVFELWEPVTIANLSELAPSPAAPFSIDDTTESSTPTGGSLSSSEEAVGAPVDYRTILSNEGITEINKPDQNGWTPLHSSCFDGNLQLTEALLQAPDIQVNTANRDGNTALHYLIRRWGKVENRLNARYANTTRCLISRGAAINAQNSFGESPLHGACFIGNLAPVKFLIGVNADLDCTTGLEETPLHYAIRSGSAELVRTLLANQCSVSERMFAIANDLGLTEIAQELMLHQDNSNELRSSLSTAITAETVVQSTKRPKKKSRGIRRHSRRQTRADIIPLTATSTATSTSTSTSTTTSSSSSSSSSSTKDYSLLQSSPLE